MARDPFAIPKLPGLPKLKLDGTPAKSSYGGQDRRKKKRVTVDQLNKIGVEALDLKPEDLEPKDRRSGITKVLDVIDLPRNVIGNLVGALAGVDRSMTRKGALGLPVVTGSDILGKLGVKSEVAKAIVGLVGDVALDPLTYLSLGASTGLSIGKHVPKVLKPGTRAMRSLAESMVKGDKVSSELAGMFGRTPERLARLGAKMAKHYGPEAAVAKLANKRGGKLLQTLASNAMRPGKAEAARAFFTKFGEKGRTVFRAPLAASGLTLPFGKRAAVYKAMAPGADATLEAIRPLAQAVSGGRATAAKIAAYNAAAKEASLAGKLLNEAKVAGKPVTDLQKAYEAAKVARATTKAALGGAKGGVKALKAAEKGVEAAQTGIKGLQTSPKASATFRGLMEQQLGKRYLTTEELLAKKAGFGEKLVNAAGRTKQALFGRGPSEIGRLGAGANAKRTAGAYVAASAARDQIGGIIQPLVDDVVAKTGQNADEVHRAIYNLIETGGPEVAKAQIWANDPVHKYLAETGIVKDLLARPDFIDAAKKVNAVTDKLRADLVKRGAQINEVEDFLERLGTKEFAEGAGAKGLRTPTAYNPNRVKMAVFTDKAGRIAHEVTTSPEHAPQLKSLDRLVKEGKLKRQDMNLSVEYWNTPGPDGRLPGQPLTGAIATEKQFQQNVAESVAATAAKATRHHATLDARDMMQPFAVKLTPAQLSSKGGEFQHYKAVKDVFKGLEETPAYQWFGKDMAAQGYAIPEEAAGQLRAMFETVNSPKAVQDILRLSDKTLNIWKRVTLMHPAYTIRNIAQNALGMTYNGISPAAALASLKPGSPIWQAVSTANRGGNLASLGKIAGMDAREFVNLARQYNILGAGFGSMVMEPGMWNKAKGMLGKFGRKWFEWNNHVEDSMRAAGWAHLIGQGMTPRQAALKIIQAMPDLTDLTLFEREAMRRVFPWFSWMRKNGSNVLKLAARNPAVIAGTDKLRRTAEELAVGDNKIEDQIRPDWMSEQQAMQIMGDKDVGTVFLLANWLPFQDMMDLFEAAQTPNEFFRSLLSKIRPDAKFMIEAGAGQDIFKRRPIEPFTTTEMLSGMPAALVGRSGTPLDSLMSIRPLREAVRTAKDMPDAKTRVLRGVLGGSLQPLTRQRALSTRYVEIKDELDKVRSAINRANTVSDNAEVAKLTRRWFQLSAELERLELPGVAKKTAGTLRRLGVKAGA